MTQTSPRILPLVQVLVSDHFLRIQASIKGKDGIAILDTGAGINVISGNLMSLLCLPFTQRKPKLRIGTLGDEVVTPIGVAHFEVTIGKTTTNIEAHVVDDFKFGDLLLGTSYMEAAKVIINMHKKEITVGEPPVTFNVFRGEVDDSPAKNYATSCPMPVCLMKVQSKKVDSYSSHSESKVTRGEDMKTVTDKARVASKTPESEHLNQQDKRRPSITRPASAVIHSMQKKHLIFMIRFYHHLRTQKPSARTVVHAYFKKLKPKRMEVIPEEDEPVETITSHSNNTVTVAREKKSKWPKSQPRDRQGGKTQKNQVKQQNKSEKKQQVMAEDMIEENEDLTHEQILFLADEWEALGEEKETPACEEPDLGTASDS